MAWAHALLFLTFAIACYLVPQSVFGDAAWQPLARLAVLVVDVQVPVLLSLHPAGLEYIDRDLGIPWPLVPLAFVGLAAVTVASLPPPGEAAAGDAA